MSSLEEQSVFTEGIYEISIMDRVVGGEGNTLNVQPKQLADRTKYLNDMYSAEHLGTGEHDEGELRVTLEEGLGDNQVAEGADIAESKIVWDFTKVQRPHGQGPYTQTSQLLEDLITLEIGTAEQDLLQSETVFNSIGDIYSKVFPPTGDIAIGSYALDGYDTVGSGGLFCKKPHLIVSEEDVNRVWFDGDIQKLVGPYSIVPVTPSEVVFPEADTVHATNRTDLMYIRCQEVNLTVGGSFYLRGYVHGEAQDWGSIDSALRSAYLTDISNNVYLHHSGDVYQIQYSFEVAPRTHTLQSIGYIHSTAGNNRYTNGEYLAAPVAKTTRLNAGSFHPVFNPKGTGFFPESGNVALDDTRFMMGDAAQLLTLNNDFSSWQKGGEVQISGSTIHGDATEEETVYTTIPDVAGGVTYVFYVDLKKVSGDEDSRELSISIVGENSANEEVVWGDKVVTLGEEYSTVGLSLWVPENGVDHLVLKIGSGGSCDFVFNAQNAMCTEDIVPPATPYSITETSTLHNTLTLLGDHVNEFPPGWTVEVENNSNEGTFVVTDVAYNGISTTIQVSPGLAHNSGSTGSLKSVQWHYHNYCFTHQSLGIGDRTTGSVLSGRTGRLDSKYHDVLYADDFVDYRTGLGFIEGSDQATLYPPTLTGLPTTVNETDQVVLTISNYDVGYTYHITANIGEVYQEGATITWTMPEISEEPTTGTLTLYVTNVVGEFSEVVSVETTVKPVAIEADESINEQPFVEDDFVLMDGVSIEDGSLVGKGSAVTQAYMGDEGWVRVQGNLSVVGATPVPISLHSSTTATSVEGEVPNNTWPNISDITQVGVTVGGIDKIVEVLSASLVEGVEGSVDTVTIELADLGSVPEAAWKPAYPLPIEMRDRDLSLPTSYTGSATTTEYPLFNILSGTESEYLAYEDVALTLDTELTTTDTVVGTSSVPGLWGEGWINNQVGLKMASGGTTLATVIASEEERLGDVSSYILTLDTPLLEAPTEAWKPTQLLPHLPLEIDAGRTTASKVVGTSSVIGALSGRDRVEVVVDGQDVLVDIAVGTEDKVGKGNDFKLVEEVGVSPNHMGRPWCTLIGPDKVLITYGDSGNAGYGTAKVLTITGDKITVGTPEIFNPYRTRYPHCTTLSPNKVLSVYQDGGNNSYGTACVLSIEGDTVIAGTPVVIEGADDPWELFCTSLSPTTALVIYGDGIVHVLTIEDTTIVVGPPTVVNEDSVWNLHCVTLSPNRVLVICAGVTSASCIVAYVLTIEGTSVIVGPPNIVVATDSGAVRCTTLSATKAVIIWFDVEVTESQLACVLTVEGDTVTAGTPKKFNGESWNQPTCTTLDSNRVMAIGEDERDNNWGLAYVLTVDNSTITVGEPVQIASLGIPDVNCIALNPYKVLAVFSEDWMFGTAIVLDSSVIEYTIDIETQAAAPTEAVLVGNSQLPKLITYDKNTSRMGIQYQEKEVEAVKQLKFGIGNIQEGQRVDNLIVDLWKV